MSCAGTPRLRTSGRSRRPSVRALPRGRHTTVTTSASGERRRGRSGGAAPSAIARGQDRSGGWGHELSPRPRDARPARARRGIPPPAGRRRGSSRHRHVLERGPDRPRGVARSSSASGVNTSRWRSTGAAIRATSSGVTYDRPASRAAAFAAPSRCTAARGLAPSADAAARACGGRRRRRSRRPRRGPRWRRPRRARRAGPRRSPPADVVERRRARARGGPSAASRAPRRRPGSRSRRGRGSGRAGPRAAGRCPRTRPGSGSPGRGTGRAARAATPSTVTCPSCIASSSAAWVLGGVRLISSARTTPANTGPGRKTSSPARSAIVPVTSDGSMSGVNCRRRNSSAERPGCRARQQRLRDAGDALQQHVAAERQRGEHVLQRLVVADDDLAYLARDAGVQLLHGRASLSGLVRTSAAASASTYSTRGGGGVPPDPRSGRTGGRPPTAPPASSAPARAAPTSRSSAARRTRARRRSRGRSRGTRPACRAPPVSASPNIALSACRARGSAAARVGEQRHAALARARRDDAAARPPARSPAACAELVPGAAVDARPPRRRTSRSPAPAAPRRARRRAPSAARRRSPRRATRSRPRRPRRAARRRAPSRRSPSPPRAPSRRDRARSASRPSAARSSATDVRSRRTGWPARWSTDAYAASPCGRRRVRRRARTLRRRRDPLEHLEQHANADQRRQTRADRRARARSSLHDLRRQRERASSTSASSAARPP